MNVDFRINKLIMSIFVDVNLKRVRFLFISEKWLDQKFFIYLKLD